MHISHAEAELGYEVQAPAHMLLNIEAAQARFYCGDSSGNRFLRFDPQPGPTATGQK
jgi:hypothetical protein